MLKSEDPLELQFWEEVRKESAVLLDEILTSLARKIVSEYGAAQKRAQQSGK